MFKKLVIALGAIAALFAVLLIGLAVVVAMQPSDFRVTRSAAVEVPASEVFAQVNDLRNWEEWSPWATLDPNAETSYEGPSSGTGAVFRWSGNEEIGVGRMTITESKPYELIRMKLEFTEPMEDSSDVEFTFTPEGEGTRVTWTMSGENNFIAKAFCLFIDMDEMVGGRFDEGLKNLKAIVEGEEGDGSEGDGDADGGSDAGGGGDADDGSGEG